MRFSWIEHIALEAACSVENEFAKGHIGGVVQRQAAVQVIILSAIDKAFDSATNGLVKARSELVENEPK